MRFPPSFLDQIRDRIPIADVVGRKVTWDKRKSQPQRGDYWACCPFHGEKTPSFHADNRRGRYHCFGCGVTGDHFTFLVEQEGLRFPEAVEQLAELAGLPMPARDREAEAREEKRASLYDVMEEAARFFEAALHTGDGAKARAYLRDRGLDPPVQKRFRIGYAPNSRNALKQHLAAKGIEHDQMVEAGLLIAGDDIPVSYDRFRDRVMFPITDLRGRVIALGGRALSADVPAKYMNSPETPLFHKSYVLFNGRAAREAARKGGTVIAVEGYTDAISCVMAGFEATVAPLGTALTEDQLRMLWQMADEPVLCFDGDEAGLKAAFRAVDLALPHLKPGKSLRFALLPDGKDPDDLIRGDGADAFGAAVEAARPLVDMVWRRETEGGAFDTPERRAGLDRALREVVAAIGDGDVRRHYETAIRDRIAAHFGDRSAPARRNGNFRRGEGFEPRRARAGVPPVSESLRGHPMVRKAGSAAGPSLSDAILIGILVHHPELAADRLEEFADIRFASREIETLAASVVAVASDGPAQSGAACRARIAAGGCGGTLATIEDKLAGAGLGSLLAADAGQHAAAVWDDAYHLRLRSGSLFNERRAVARALGQEASDLQVTRLRDIQDQEIRGLNPESEQVSAQGAIRHPFKMERP